MKESDSSLWYCRVKPNIKNVRGARLHNNWEHFTIGFFLEEGGRGMEHYNFQEKKNQNSVVIANAISKKILHSSDNKPINVYQKPRKLVGWMVGHWSWPREWVLNLFSSSGKGMASCMAYGRNYVAVEKDPWHAMVLKERVLQLEEKDDPNLKVAKLMGYEIIQADAA
jgi:DNA modification methylase